MTAAIALAVVLVIGVAGVSLAMQSSHATTPTSTPRAARPPRSPAAGVRKVRDRRAASPPPAPSPPPPQQPKPEAKPPELLRNGVAADAKVINVVDERTLGPVTRSRLTLRIQPEGEDGFEVTVRHAFPSAESRAKVRIGGTVAVRYDPEEHRKVVLDPGTA